MRRHTFVSEAVGRCAVGIPGFCGSLRDYMVTRTCQLRARNALMVGASEIAGEFDDKLLADLLWLSSMLAHEIADAASQGKVNEGIA